MGVFLKKFFSFGIFVHFMKSTGLKDVMDNAFPWVVVILAIIFVIYFVIEVFFTRDSDNEN